MTYCLGWKSFGCVFLFSDTLLSRFDGDANPPSIEKTSFSELQGAQLVNGRRAVVEEGGVKIRTFKKTAITYSGCVKTALALADAVQQCLELGYSAPEALNLALISVQPIDPDSDASLLLASHENGGAELFHLNTQTGVQEVQELIHEGSIGDCHRENIENMVARIREEIQCRYHPQHHSQENVLIRISAVLQSLGIHDLIVTEGVGGAFVGVCISEEGVFWQPDTLYVVHPPMPNSENIFVTGLFVRNQAISLISTATEINKVIATPLKDETKEARMVRAQAEADNVIKKFDTGRFRYLVFLNTGPHIATVLEMNEQLYHGLAMIDAESIIIGRLGIVWTESLLRIINQIPPDEDGAQPDLALWWFPFWPASEGEIAALNDYFAELRAAEIEEW